MKRFIEVMRVTIISPEMAIAVTIGGAAARWPKVFSMLAGMVRFERIDTSVLALAAAPTALVVAAYKCTDEILRPNDEARRVLANWPGYLTLKTAAIVGILFAAAGELAWAVGLGMLQFNRPVAGAAIALGGLAVSVVAVSTLALARIQVRDIVDGAGERRSI